MRRFSSKQNECTTIEHSSFLDFRDAFSSFDDSNLRNYVEKSIWGLRLRVASTSWCSGCRPSPNSNHPWGWLQYDIEIEIGFHFLTPIEAKLNDRPKFYDVWHSGDVRMTHLVPLAVGWFGFGGTSGCNSIEHVASLKSPWSQSISGFKPVQPHIVFKSIAWVHVLSHCHLNCSSVSSSFSSPSSLRLSPPSSLRLPLSLPPSARDPCVPHWTYMMMVPYLWPSAFLHPTQTWWSFRY